MTSPNPFTSADKAASRAVQQSSLQTAVVDKQLDNGVRLRMKSGTTKRAAVLTDKLPKQDEQVFVTSDEGGSPIVVGTLGVEETTSESDDGGGITTHVQDSRPPESDASKGDHWLDIVGYDPDELWKFSSPNTSGTPRGGVAYDGTYVYVADRVDYVFALDPSDGSVVWETNIGNTVTTTIADDASYIYVGTRSSPTVVRLAKSDGAIDWTYTAPNDIEGDIIIDDTNVYAVETYNYSICCIDKSTGGEQWNTSLNVVEDQAQLAQDSTRLFVNDTGDDDVLALNKSDGSEAWRYSGSNFLNSGITADSDTVYASGYSFHAINKSDGSQKWTFPDSEFNPYAEGFITHDDTSLYFEDSYSIVYSLAKTDASVNWSIRLDDDATDASNSGELVVEGGYLYGLSRTHEVFAIDVTNGEIQWTFDVSIALEPHGVAVGSNSVYFSTDESTRNVTNLSIDRFGSASNHYAFDGNYWSRVQ